MLRINNLVPEILYTTAQEAQDPAGDLKTATNLLPGLKWFLGFGTALGFYREGDFIERDTDIDICILADDKTDYDEIIDRFGKYWNLVRTVDFDGLPQQHAFQGKDRFIIDLCYFHKDGDIYRSYCEGGKWEDDVRTIGRPKLVKTIYGHFFFPENMEKYLTSRYGDWRTPRIGAITSSLKV